MDLTLSAPHAVRAGAVETTAVWHRWSWRLICAALLLLPFRATVGPAVLNLEWFDVLACAFLVTATAAGVWRTTAPQQVLGWVAVYVAAMLPSLLNTAHLGGSCAELIKTAYVACVAFALARWASEPSAWKRLVRAFVISVGAIILFSLGVWVYATLSGHVPARFALAEAIPNVGRMVRVKATLQTFAMLANYLTMGIPMLAAYAAATSSRPRTMCWLILIAGLLAAATTGSNGLVGCCLAAAIVAPRTTRWDRIGRAALVLLVVGVFLFAQVASTAAILGVRASTRPMPLATTSGLPPQVFPDPVDGGKQLTVQVSYVWAIYGLLHKLAWETWREHPWIGIGVGEFSSVSARAAAMGRLNSAWDPHSTWFGALAETGLIGLLGLAAMWIALLRRAAAGQRAGPTAGDWRVRAPLAGLVGLLVNSLHADIMHFRFLWIGIAWLVAARSRPTME